MICRFCGTALPGDAMYCGECGRAVATPVVTASLSFSSPGSTAEPAERPAATADSEYSCPQCGEPIGADDVFCGECGFVLPAPDADSVPRPAGAASPFAPPAPDADSVPRRTGAASPFAPPMPVADSARPPTGAASLFAPRPRTGGHAAVRDAPDPFPWGADPRPTVDLEATRVVAGPSPEERFVLQFSTGESVTVTGAGLVGRNPASQPGEFVDQLVAIFDAGKSVSKTHLEFGQEGGRFWVSDRYSTNGSIVRQPDAEPKRCEPGRRYFVARGTRVDIGEQFFVVS